MPPVMQERAENYTPTELSELKLVSQKDVDAFNEYYSEEDSNILVVYGGRGRGKSLYSYKTAVDHTKKQGFGKVGNLVYQNNHKLEFRVDGKSYDLDISVVPFLEKGSKMILHDFHYMVDACVAGEFSQEDLASVLKMADKMSEKNKVVMITDTHMAKYYDPINVPEGGVLITNPDVIYYFAKFGFVNESDTQDTVFSEDVRDAMKRGIKDSSSTDRFMTMNPLLYDNWKKLFTSQFKDITADLKSLRILFYMNKNPRRLVRAMDYFGEDKSGGGMYINFDSFTKGITDRVDNYDISKILGINKNDKEAIKNIIGTSSEFIFHGWYNEVHESHTNPFGEHEMRTSLLRVIQQIGDRGVSKNDIETEKDMLVTGEMDFDTFNYALKRLQYYKFDFGDIDKNYKDILNDTMFSMFSYKDELASTRTLNTVFDTLVRIKHALTSNDSRYVIDHRHLEELEKIGIVRCGTEDDDYLRNFSIPNDIIEFVNIIEQDENIRGEHGRSYSVEYNSVLRRVLFNIYSDIHEEHLDPIDEIRKVKAAIVKNAKIVRHIDDSGNLTKNTIEMMVAHPQHYIFPGLLGRIFPDVFGEDSEISG